ncbi:MAG: hypothetical protein WC197_05550 [Candidatus Gastranaerophilaceae bacterium]|jgi:hypothetical protein
MDKYLAFKIENLQYGPEFNEKTIYATKEILSKVSRGGTTIKSNGFQNGKHLLSFLKSQFNGINNFELYLSNNVTGKYKINQNKVFINFKEYLKFAYSVSRTENKIPEIKFSNALNTVAGKTKSEISLLVPKYYFEKKEDNLLTEISVLENREIFNLIATQFKAIVQKFDLFNIKRQNELLKAFENSTLEAKLLKDMKKMNVKNPELKFKQFVVSLSNKSPKEINKVLNNIAKSERSNKVLEKLNSRLKKSGFTSLKDQNKFIEDFDMVSSLAPRIKKLKTSLTQFEAKIKKLKYSKKFNEKEIHAFIAKNYWLLGIEYYKKPKYSSIDSLGNRTDSQVMLGDRSKPDIIIETIDGSNTAIYFELEEVKDKIFVKGIKQSEVIAKDTIEAIGQAVRYTLQSKMKGQFPRAKVIVGLVGKNKKYKEKLAMISEYLGHIEVISYEDLIDKAKNTISFFETYNFSAMEE